MAQEVITKPKHAGGRPPKFTVEVVDRISKRVAKGLTVEQACILEDPPMDAESFRRACNTRPEIRTVYQKRRAEYVEAAIDRLAAGSAKDNSGLIFLLRCRQKEQFSTAPEVSVTQVNQTNFVLNDAEASDLQARARRMFAASPN